MSNTKVTAQLLESAGWTEAQIDRYYKLLNRKQVHGLGGLTVSDRRFYNSATAACGKAQAAIDKAIREGQTRRVSGKQPVETKLHYRWRQADLLLYKQMAELLPGEELAQVILREEQMRALEIYQPVLDQVDTAQRRKWNPIEVELIDLAKSIGRCFPYDGDAHREAMKAQFAENWNDRWEETYGHFSVPALSGEDAIVFRTEVRLAVEQFTRSFPSVRQTVAV